MPVQGGRAGKEEGETKGAERPPPTGVNKNKSTKKKANTTTRMRKGGWVGYSTTVAKDTIIIRLRLVLFMRMLRVRNLVLLLMSR